MFHDQTRLRNAGSKSTYGDAPVFIMLMCVEKEGDGIRSVNLKLVRPGFLIIS